MFGPDLRPRLSQVLVLCELQQAAAGGGGPAAAPGGRALNGSVFMEYLLGHSCNESPPLPPPGHANSHRTLIGWIHIFCACDWRAIRAIWGPDTAGGRRSISAPLAL